MTSKCIKVVWKRKNGKYVSIQDRENKLLPLYTEVWKEETKYDMQYVKKKRMREKEKEKLRNTGMLKQCKRKSGSVFKII